MKRLLVLMLSVSCLAGCSQGFVYQRKPDPVRAVPKLPVKVAVVAFEDGTGDFTVNGDIFGGYIYNFAKRGLTGWPPDTRINFIASALPPAVWAKSLAEDLAASGLFTSVKFMYTPSEVTDENFAVEGALTKAYFTTIKEKPDEFFLHLKVRRIPDNSVAWEGDVGKSGIRPPNLAGDCFFRGCFDERIHGYLNGVMQSIFADARLALVQGLAVPQENKPEIPKQESPDEVIKRILGKP